ncbi:hypothetical protein ACFL5D_04685 [Candidatus Neomarinimicrobiota bacterium]
MKYFKILLTILIILFLSSSISCKKDSTTGPVFEQALVGIWSVENEFYNWLLTTNSNQTAITPFKSDGQITVGDAVNTTLDILLINYSEDGDILMVKLDDELNFVYTLYKPAGGNEARFIIQATQQRFSGILNYTFANSTLTVAQSTFTDAATNETVTANGTISVINTDIPANVPTEVSIPDVFIDSGGIINVKTYEFKNEGTFTHIVLSANSSTTSGTYSTSGNQLTLVDQSGNTAVYDYSILDNMLTLSQSDFFDFCTVLGNFNNQAECIQRAEQVFNLTAGSLTAMTTQAQITLTKAGVKLKIF